MLAGQMLVALCFAELAADLVTAAAGLDPMIVALHDARTAAEHVAAIRSVVLEALIRRLVELAVADAGDPPAPFTWFASGSLARREVVPSSDVDSALAWQEEGARATTREYMARLAATVDRGLRACGVRPDAHGASASNSQFARSLASWHAAVRSLRQNPAREEALALLSMLTDSRPVWGTGPGAPAADTLWEERDRRNDPDLQRLLALFALSFRPPTGFLRDFVVEHSGERKGQLDIKHTELSLGVRWG